jgi:hypothetical protein
MVGIIELHPSGATCGRMSLAAIPRSREMKIPQTGKFEEIQGVSGAARNTVPVWRIRVAHVVMAVGLMA